MDQLFSTASAFSNLLNIEYEILIGRKNQTTTLNIVFHKTHFYHLAGLHYLTDIQNLKGNREILFDSILAGNITSADIEKSFFYSKISSRLIALASLENLFDSDNLVFKYNSELKTYSLIETDYLMQNVILNNKIFTFLSKNPDNKYFCRSFFPMEKQDFSVGQTNWTVLLKKKKNMITNEVKLLFQHKNYKKN